MMRKERKPELYFKHKDILNQTQLDKSSFGLYLHENMLDFFTDISDIASCLDIYSLTDYCESSVTYSFDVSLRIPFHNLLYSVTTLPVRVPGAQCDSSFHGHY